MLNCLTSRQWVTGNMAMSVLVLKRRLVWVASLLLLIILMFGLRSFPSLVEEYYSSKAYPLIRSSLQFFFNSFSFSVGDMLYLLIIIGLIVCFIQILRLAIKKRFREGAFMLLSLILNLKENTGQNIRAMLQN